MQKIMFNDRYGLTQAVLEGRKTMTRRMIAAPKTWHGIDVYGFSVNKDNLGNVMDITLVGADGGSIEDENGSLGMILPKYKIGEVVAVAQSYNEIWNTQEEDFRIKIGMQDEYSGFIYTKFIENGGWTNKMFVRADLMPHQIRITDIKVERLQEISDEDCLREGIRVYQSAFPPQFTEIYVGSDIVSVPQYGFDDFKLKIFHNYDTKTEAYSELIERVSGKGTWSSNPYVFVYEFELVK